MLTQQQTAVGRFSCETIGHFFFMHEVQELQPFRPRMYTRTLKVAVGNRSSHRSDSITCSTAQLTAEMYMSFCIFIDNMIAYSNEDYSRSCKGQLADASFDCHLSAPQSGKQVTASLSSRDHLAPKYRRRCASLQETPDVKARRLQKVKVLVLQIQEAFNRSSPCHPQLPKPGSQLGARPRKNLNSEDPCSFAPSHFSVAVARPMPDPLLRNHAE